MARTAVIAGTATAVSGKVQRSAEEKSAQQDQQQAEQVQRAADAAPAAPSPAPAPEDRMAKIRELGQMKADGLLTEEEFAAEKAKILAS